jgi:hypothetical protein
MLTESPSSQNALTHGLYAARDFIRQGEESEYAQILQSATAEIEPVGIIEETFAAEVVGATWRLRRCRMVEQSLSRATLDPMVDDDAIAQQQKSVDRARAQSHNILRRSIAELRKLQTERIAREQAAESRRRTELELMRSLAEEMAEDDEAENLFCNSETPSDPVGQISDLPEEIPFCNSPESGQKFKLPPVNSALRQ